MTHEQILELLDDFVAGDLPPREERDVRRHLMQCEACRAEEQALRALLDEAAALPDEIVPARDLWNDIAPRLQSRGSLVDEPDALTEVRVIGPRPARPLPWWMSAAAAIALVVTTSFATLQFSDRRAETVPAIESQQAQAPQGAAPRNATTALVAFKPAEQEYEKAISDLQIVLQTQRGRMAPETAATLEANLKIIDKAIAESRAALAADPNSAELTHMLSDAYNTKLDVLRQAVSL
ncbi:anti-sigma factor family protein [Longimicrobium sp.]|uniref:anti-sigma factor family protein n=1 Tax=Longimicrobium sp. TaxID=2029185 RepID=UPI003B3A37CA